MKQLINPRQSLLVSLMFLAQLRVISQTNFNITIVAFYYLLLLYPRSTKGEGGILFYLCSSVHPSVRPRYFSLHFSVTVDVRNLIFGHKCHIGTPYRGKRFWTRQIPTSCLATFLIFIRIEHICPFFVAFFSATIDGRNQIFGHKLHIGSPYRGKRFWTHQIPTSCLPILLIFIHIEHTFVYAHFSSHFSKQLLMTRIWYLVTSFI